MFTTRSRPAQTELGIPSGFLHWLYLAAIACVLCGCSILAATAEAAQEIVRVDGEPFVGELAEVAADGRMMFRIPADADRPATRELASQELVRWGHPVAARGQTMVVLADGGRLITAPDWSGGAAVRLEAAAVVVLTGMHEEVRLPRAAVRGVVFAQRLHPDRRLELADQVLATQSDRDLVMLTNGDRAVGEVTELAGGTMTIAVENGTAKLPLSRAEAVVLAHGQWPDDDRPAAELIVGLRDGTLVYAQSIRANEERLAIELAVGSKLTGGTVRDIVLLHMLGGRTAYLSDIEAADYRHVPYLSAPWPYKRDRNVLGAPLAVRGERYLKGLGMHSAARLTYRLDDAYRRFDASVAIDDSAGGRGSVTFGVYVLRDGAWHEAFLSDIVRGNDPPQPVEVDVRGAAALTLTVDFADRGDELDRAVWLDARLVKD